MVRRGQAMLGLAISCVLAATVTGVMIFVFRPSWSRDSNKTVSRNPGAVHRRAQGGAGHSHSLSRHAGRAPRRHLAVGLNSPTDEPIPDAGEESAHDREADRSPADPLARLARATVNITAARRDGGGLAHGLEAERIRTQNAPRDLGRRSAIRPLSSALVPGRRADSTGRPPPLRIFDWVRCRCRHYHSIRYRKGGGMRRFAEPGIATGVDFMISNDDASLD